MPIDEDAIKDSSLLSCTLKKSGQVLKKVVLYASYVIVAVAVIAIMYYGAITVYNAILPGITSIWWFLVAVPWYIYAGILIIAAIPVYSVLWCIARDLTEVDWKSEAANNFALALLAPTLLTLTVDPGDHITCWYYIFRFPGAAWHHYRRR